MTSTICDGSAIEAKRLRTSTCFEAFRRAQPRGHVVERLRLERHADAHAGEPAHSSSLVAVLPWIWIAVIVSGAVACEADGAAG